MAYEFKDTTPRPEALAQEGYYRDWTHMDPGVFYEITSLSKFIREKGHGQDTREAMAQALERVYHDASQSGNANMEVSQARGTYETLGQRINDLASKANNSMSQTEFDSWVATLLDGGPSIFMDSLSQLQSTYPQGAAGVALVRETDPAKIYVWNGTSWEDFGDYQGVEVADGSVTDEKLSNSLHKRIVEGLINIPNTLNLVHPDNFTQAWPSSNSATVELSNNVAHINLHTTTSYARARLPIAILETPDVGDVLYVRLKLNAIEVQNVVWLAVSYNSHGSQSRADINTVTGYQSGVLSYNPIDGLDNESFYIKSQLQLGTSATIEVSEMMVINLTKMYGVGKEPSQAEFDDYLASNNINYWEKYQEVNLLQMIQETRRLIDDFEAPTQKEQKLENMMWTWHTTPMAIYSEKSQKTFVGGVMRGASNNLAGHMIYSIDELTGEVVGNQVSNRFAGDDHNMVAFAELPWRDEIMVFYAGHSGNGIYYKYMRNYDVNDLSQEYMIPNSTGSTYINVHHSQGSDTMYIISRVTSVGSFAIYWTEDFGTTWQHRQFTTGNVYLDAGKRRRKDDKMGITLSGHGGTGFSEIYYCYLTLAGTVHLPDGTQIADVKSGEGLPLERTNLKLVATNPDSKTTVTSVKGYDDRLTFIHAPDEDNFETFNYKYAIYNTTTDEFDTYDVMTGARGNLSPESHPHYVGSTCDVGFNNAHIYSSNYNPQTQKWEIWEHAARSNRPDDGWNITKMAESDLKLFRPITVMYDFNSRKPIPGFWLKGYFTHYEDYFAEAVMPFGMGENFE